jgi:hypothetical protein
MADQKISELTVDASLDGSEIVPVVQNGNKRTTAAAIAATLPDATTSAAGKMTATDKTRLDQLGADDSPTFAGLTITSTDPVVIPHIHGDLAGTLYFHVKNTSGGTLTKGTPVSVVGAVGDTTTLEVVATNPGVAGRTHAHGLLYSELANNGFGHAVVLGELQGMNTAALASSPELWVGAAGGTTGTRPATAAQQVATVGRQHATTGTLLVSIEGVEPTPAQIGAQPLDADLTEIAALTTAAFGRDLLTATDAAAARIAIEAGTSDVEISTATPQAPGTPAAGTTGQAADAGHVHALPGVVSTTTPGLAPATGFSALAYAATVDLDMAALDGQMRTITLTGDLTFTSSNRATGRTVVLRLLPGATQRTLNFPADWVFVCAKPANIAISKTAVLSLTFFGTSNTDCVAAYAVQP